MGDFTRPTSDIRGVEAREAGIYYDLVLITKNGKEKLLIRTIHDFKSKVKDFAKQTGRFIAS